MKHDAIFLDTINNNIGIIRKVCRSYTHTSHEYQDLEADIIAQLWKAFPSFRGEAKIQTWMYRIALNTALMTLRKRTLKTEELTEVVHSADLMHKEQQSEQIRRIYEFIHTLHASEKSIMLLYLDEFSYAEIADITGLSEKNVSVKITRLKKALLTWLSRLQEVLYEQ